MSKTEYKSYYSKNKNKNHYEYNNSETNLPPGFSPSDEDHPFNSKECIDEYQHALGKFITSNMNTISKIQENEKSIGEMKTEIETLEPENEELNAESFALASENEELCVRLNDLKVLKQHLSVKIDELITDNKRGSERINAIKGILKKQQCVISKQ